MTAGMVDYQVSTPTLNGGAAEEPKSFKVVAKAITQEEEEQAKTHEKGQPVSGCQNGWRMSIACRHPDVPAESPVDGSHQVGTDETTRRALRSLERRRYG